MTAKGEKEIVKLIAFAEKFLEKLKSIPDETEIKSPDEISELEVAIDFMEAYVIGYLEDAKIGERQ